MNIPKLRFKDNNGNDYPQWNHSSFYNTFNFLSTNNYSRNDMNSINGNIRNIHYGDILTKFNYIINTEKDILPYLNDNIIIKNLPNYIIQSGDIVIADTAEDYTTGKTCEIINSNNQLVVAGLHTMLCRPKQNIFALGFLGYFMNSNIYHNQLLPLITGIKVYSIIKKEIIKTKISIPFIEEQKKIAKFLTTVDKKIENLANTITSLENQKKGLLQQIFSQKLRFKNENGNNYPDWEKKKLGQYINYKKGYAFKSELYTNKGIRIIRVSDLSATSIKNDSPIYISRSLYTNYLDWKLYTNDIIITTVGSKPPIYDSMVGKVILFPDNLPYKCFLNQNAVIIRACTQVNQKFLYYTLSLNKYINHIKNILRGNANQANITLVDLFEYKIPLPCLEEQTKIADFLSAFDRKLDNQKAQLEHWQQIKKGLLQQMFV